MTATIPYNSPGNRKKVLIIGAGVIGLTSAIELADEYDVTIVAERIGDETNSALATAVWHVFLVRGEEELEEGDIHLTWAEQTLHRLIKLADTPGSGVEMINGVELMRKPMPHQWPAWMKRAYGPPTNLKMLSYEEIAPYNRYDQSFLTENERNLLRAKPVQYGYTLTVPAACMVTHLQWLEQKARAAGVDFQRQKLKPLHDPTNGLNQLGIDVIVNCTGLEAEQFVDDKDFTAYRGEYFAVNTTTNTPRFYIGDDDHPEGMAYAVPRMGKVMVGGLAVRDEVKVDSPAITWSSVRKRAGLYFDWLLSSEAVPNSIEPIICLRPVRSSGARIEIERTDSGLTIIHNFGHGASGWSMCWGCAAEVKNLVAKCLS